jgi:lysozyme
VTPALRARLTDTLYREEGYRQHPYRDTEGVLTVGVGRNLEAKGIRLHEAMALLGNDLEEAAGDVAARWPWTATLGEVRLGTLIEMCFNLGPTELAAFRKMWAELKAGDFERAAAEILDSDAARSPEAPGLRRRYARFARQMARGAWDDEA